MAFADGDGIHLNGAIKVSGYSANSGSYDVVEPDFKRYQYSFVEGILVGRTQGAEVPHEEWHTWEVSEVTYSAIILGVGVTQANFPDVDPTLAYYPYIQCADNVEPPLLEGIKFNGTTCIVRFTAVTSAQAGSGQTSECVIKLRKVV